MDTINLLKVSYENTIINNKLRELYREIKSKAKKIRKDKKELKQLITKIKVQDKKLKVQDAIIKYKHQSYINERTKLQEIRSLRKQQRKELKKLRYEKKQKELDKVPKAQSTNDIETKIISAFEENISQISYINRSKTTDIRKLEHDIVSDLLPRIRHAIIRFGEVKVHFSIEVQLTNPDNESLVFYHTNNSITMNNNTNIMQEILNQLASLINAVQDADVEGSGWVIEYISVINVVIIKNPNMRGGSYIDTPKMIKFRQAVTNIQNKNDNECFKWCILASLYPAPDHAYRVAHYKKIDHKLKFESFPMRIKDIPKFEEQNKISVSVYGYSIEGINESFYPLYNTKYKFDKHIELLYLESETVDQDFKKKYHYVLINDFNRLVSKSIGVKNNVIICRKCINPFYSQETYDKHAYFCTNNETQCIMPSKDKNKLMFKHTSRMLRHPISIYADLEALLVKENDKSHHVPHSSSFVVVGQDMQRFELYRGKDCMDKFVEGIKETVELFAIKQQQFKDVKMKLKDFDDYKQATKCWICNEEFNQITIKSKSGTDYKPKKKVIDHCHFTGNYIGAAHYDCNFKRQNERMIPIFIHNLSGYDSHMIIKTVSKFGDGVLKIIPKTGEEYISFSKSYKTKDGKFFELRFLDSFRFMSSSLDSLATNLLLDNKSKFTNLLKFTTKEEQDAIFWEERIETKTNELILDKEWNTSYKTVKNVNFNPRIKGIYPYEFTDSFEKFEYSEILTKEHFYDNLNQKSINEQEYDQYKKVWESIPNCNLGKYSDLYLKTDVLVLADIMENFRNIGLKHYKPNILFYYTWI